jgi:hypothetical protein
MLGHFRHEVGHCYQNVLVETGSGADKYLADCRTLFGDERISYADEIARHYKFGAPEGWAETFISEYATMHPWEDFAECFAHYLHITDSIDTAREAGMVLHADRVRFSVPRDIEPLQSPPTCRSNACCTTGDGCRCCSIASTPRWVRLRCTRSTSPPLLSPSSRSFIR